MPETSKDLVDRLASAALRMSWEEVSDVVGDFERFVNDEHGAGRMFPEQEASSFLAELRKKRRFEDMERAAEALREAGQNHPRVSRQLVQALIDQGELADAWELAQGLVERTRGDPSNREWAEARGLRRRILKQMYVDADPRPSKRIRQKLCRAIESYREVFETDRREHHWHGINVVACLARAERDGVDCGAGEDWRTLAHEIRESIRPLNETNEYNMWAWASALEASIALEELEEAGRWLNRYLGCRMADAFEFAATHRQLVEVWQLVDRGPPLSELLVPLRGALMQKVGGVLDLPWDDDVGQRDSAAAAEGRELQRTWGSEASRDGAWLDRLHRKMTAVARVERDVGSVGTAFVMRGEELRREWSGLRLIVTAAHVVCDPPHPNGIGPAQARLHFTRHSSGDKERFRVKDCVWSDSHLDVSILVPEGLPEDLADIGLVPSSYVQADAEPRPRLYVVGHPKGGEIAVSLFDNHLEEIRRPHVLYRSPTEKGHSGSPVMSEDFEAVAVHLAARTDRECNEGLLADEMLSAFRAHPPDRPS